MGGDDTMWYRSGDGRTAASTAFRHSSSFGRSHIHSHLHHDGLVFFLNHIYLSNLTTVRDWRCGHAPDPVAAFLEVVRLEESASKVCA